MHNIKYKKIKIGSKYIDAICVRLQSKNFILIRGKKGYVMCGYLDLKTAEKFRDTAVKITGVSSITQALRTKVYSCSSPARKLGIYKGQPIKETLKVIA